MKKILITGAAGFIGFTLCRKLFSEKVEIIAVDNFSDYYDPILKEERYNILVNESKEKSVNLTFARLDILDIDKLSSFLDSNRPDVICHLAAQAGVRYSLENPKTYIDNNLTGTSNLLEYAQKNQVSDFILASTSSVYGLNEDAPFSEDSNINSTISPYATTKRACELLCHTYNHIYGIKIRILRFFTVYGPWGRPDMALFLFTKAILEGQPIKVFNGGNMKRDFTYVDDIVSGFISAIFSDFDFEIFNLGYGSTVELTDFISILEDNLGLEAQKIFLPLQPGDVPATWSNIEKAKKLLNYRPKTDVKRGIKNFVQWYLKNYHK